MKKRNIKLEALALITLGIVMILTFFVKGEWSDLNTIGVLAILMGLVDFYFEKEINNLKKIINKLKGENEQLRNGGKSNGETPKT